MYIEISNDETTDPGTVETVRDECWTWKKSFLCVIDIFIVEGC